MTDWTYPPYACACTATTVCPACRSWAGGHRASTRMPRRPAPRSTCKAHRYYDRGCVRCQAANRAYQEWRQRAEKEER